MRKLTIPNKAIQQHTETLGAVIMQCLFYLENQQPLTFCSPTGTATSKKFFQPTQKYWEWLYNEFTTKKILTADPSVLLPFCKDNSQKLGRLNKTQQSDVYKVVKKLFNYDAFRQGKMLCCEINNTKINVWWSNDKNYLKEANWSLADFVRLLDVRYCPYCNAETVGIVYPDQNNKKPTFSAIDHILPKETYPLLALSLYNLVPACYRCNSQFKGRTDSFDINNWKQQEPFKGLHPYFHNVHKWFRFEYDIKRTHDLFLKPNQKYSPLSTSPRIPKERESQQGANRTFFTNRTNQYLNDYRILTSYRDLYATEINEILMTEAYCSPTFIKTMKDKYPNMSDKCFNLIFRRSSLAPKEINKHRFAKLIIDLHGQISNNTQAASNLFKESQDFKSFKNIKNCNVI